MDYKFTKIMLGYDDSPASLVALDKALKTCRAFKTDLYVVYVKSKNSSENNFAKQIQDKANVYGVKINYIEKQGNVSREISHFEKELKSDLIFMGAHGVNGFQPFWAGSNTLRVVGASNCPVITVQETAIKSDFSRIILPLDDSEDTRQKVPYSVIIAKAFNSTVHIVSLTKSKNEEIHNKLNIYGRQVQDFLEEREIKHTYELRQGNNLPQMCIDYANEKNAGLILMMTETVMLNWFMGTGAQQLINHSPVPVMAIHTRDLMLSGTSGY
ncbi:MAG: universal stress protein [Bacteroidetes bacterium]|nr:universal stress protein [Bacteroidota bacterium]